MTLKVVMQRVLQMADHISPIIDQVCQLIENWPESTGLILGALATFVMAQAAIREMQSPASSRPPKQVDGPPPIIIAVVDDINTAVELVELLRRVPKK